MDAGGLRVERLLLRPAELGDAIGVSRSRAYALLASGEIPSVRIGGSIRIPVDALKSWVAERATQALNAARDAKAIA